MPALHVRDVPESVLAGLRERAERHGHSVQKEVRQILAAAAAARGAATATERVQLSTVRTTGTSSWSRAEIYGGDGR